MSGFRHSCVSLKGRDIGDDDLVPLEVLYGLEFLNLIGTQVPGAGVARSETAIFNLVIIRETEAWGRLISAPDTRYLGSQLALDEYGK